MTDFGVGEDGLMVERSVQDLAAWYCQFDEAGNSLNYEAHVMLLRAYVSLVSLTSGTGLPRARYNVLRILYQQPGRRLQMTDISVGLNVSATNVTKLVHGLQQDGLVRRVPDQGDKRRIWTEITEAGEAVFLRALPRVVKHTDGIWDNFSNEEKRILVHLLAKLRMVLRSRAIEDTLQDFKTHRRQKKTGS